MAKTSAFSVVIKEIRKRRRLSQEGMAELLDLSVEAVSKLERGVTKPRLATLESISQKLKVPMSDLIGYLDDTKGRDQQRVKLEIALIELARKVDIKTLKMMVKQFEAVAKNSDD